MLSTEGLKMSCSTYKDNVSSIITISHQTRSFYWFLYLLILGRGGASAFCFASLCASAMQQWSFWSLPAAVAVMAFGDFWAGPQSAAGQRSQHDPSSSAPRDKQLQCPSAASAPLKTSLTSRAARQRNALTPFRAWQYSFHKSFWCLPHFQELAMKAQLCPWTLSRQGVTMHPVCMSCLVHSELWGRFTESTQAVLNWRKRQKSKYLSLQAKQAVPQAPSENTQCLVRYCSWNMYSCRITTDHIKGSPESWWHGDRSVSQTAQFWYSLCHSMPDIRIELCGCWMQQQIRSKLSSTWEREHQWD